MRSRDHLLDDTLGLVKAWDIDKDAFVEALNATDCAEHHKLIIRLVQLVRVAANDEFDGLTDVVEVMQTGLTPW